MFGVSSTDVRLVLLAQAEKDKKLQAATTKGLRDAQPEPTIKRGKKGRRKH